MPSTTREVRGRVVDRASRLGVPGLRVETWDRETRLAEVITDADGRVSIAVAEQQKSGRHGASHLRVYRGPDLLTVLEITDLGDVEILVEVELTGRDTAEDGDPSGSDADARRAPVSGRLLDARTGAPLSGYVVHASLRDGRHDGQDLGDAVSASDGRFDFVDPRLATVEDGEERGLTLALLVRDPAGKQRLVTELRAELGGDPVPIWVPREEDREPPSPPLNRLEENGGPGIPRRLLERLRDREATTLEDVRRIGGVSRLEGLSEREREAARLLDAHADLARLSPDVRANATLIERHYDSTTRIAATPLDRFVRKASEGPGDAEAARLHAAARAERNVLRNFLTGARAEIASDLTIDGPLDAIRAAAGPKKCSCRDCETAVSPLAYLTDLLQYALDHVRNTWAYSITLDWLTTTFHQPFGDLPVACEVMDERIRQVRLCVEVLRRHLTGLTISQAAIDRLADDEREYRIAAYRALLERAGTSYDELRLIRDAKQEEREALAVRLGFSLGPTRPDRLDHLLLDPKTFTEADLERLFGLVDTRTSRDPLSDGLVLDDPQGQVTRWDLTRSEWEHGTADERKGTWEGVEWRRTTDDEGLIHVRLRKLASGAVRVELFRDEARTELLADGERPDAVGSVYLVERNGCGLVGVVHIRYVADSATIRLAAVPRLLCWRLAELRVIWAKQDRPERPPSIDPDLIEPAELRDPLAGPAAGLWQARRAEVDTLLKDLRAARQGAATPAAALEAALLHPKSLGQPSSFLANLEAQRASGADIRPQLAAQQLGLPAYEMLARVRRLVSATPSGSVLDDEWDEVDAILAQVYKTRQAPARRNQEAPPAIAEPGLTLGPDFFALPKAAPLEFSPPPPRELRRWLASREARRDWERTLKARAEQHRDTIDGWLDAVRAAEGAAITGLRDALVQAAGGPGSDLKAKAKLLGDRLLIDCANSTCQMTTRIAQAIETIQVLLFSIRTGQFLDTYPTLLLIAPEFEGEWQWIGSYAPWRAAMLVFMYPENVAHPALRDRQSPGFKRLVRDLRALPAVTPEHACRLAKQYAAYFEDVCNLAIEASCSTVTRVFRGTGCRDRRPVQDREVLHLFGRRPDGHTVYWSTFDDRLPEPQSFWDWVPGFEGQHVLEVVGATAYELPGGARFLYVFVRALTRGTQTLLFTRYDLERGAWDAGHTALEPPKKGHDFEAVLLPGPEGQPPLLRLRHPPGGGPGSAVFQRSLNRDGTNWAEGDWFQLVFSPWYRIGGLPALPGTKVAAAAPAAERIELVTVGADGGVYHAWWRPVSGWGWTEWARVDANFTVPAGSPVTTTVARHTTPPILELFIVGHDNRLWSISAKLNPDGPEWSSWYQIGQPTNTLPQLTPITAINHSSGLTLLLMLNESGVPTCVRRTPGTSFDPWFPVVNPAVDRFPRPAPVGAVVSVTQHWESVVSTLAVLSGKDGRVYWTSGSGDHKANTWGNSWYPVSDLIVTPGSPVSSQGRIKTAFTGKSYTELDHFVVGGDGGIHSYWGRWTFHAPSTWMWVQSEKWFRVGGLNVPRRSPITALARGERHLDLFVVGKDGRVYTAWWDEGVNDGEWNEWYANSAPHETFPQRAPVAALERRPGHMDLFVIGHDGGIYSAWWDQDPNAQWVEKPYMVVPQAYRPEVTGLFDITEQLSDADLQLRRAQVRQAYLDNELGDPTNQRLNLDYLNEATCFSPLLLALELQGHRHYTAALDWFKTVYNYSVPEADRDIAYLLGMNSDWTKAYQRAEDWLLDPLNPHRVAETRPRAYARYVIICLIRCFLEYADDEYARDTSESVPRARVLYETALELEATPELRRNPYGCDALVGRVELELGEGHWEQVWRDMADRLERLGDHAIVQSAVTKLEALRGSEALPAERLLRAREVVAGAAAQAGPPLPMAAVLERRASDEARAHAALLAVPEIDRAARRAARLMGDRLLDGVAAAAGTDVRTLREERPPLPWLYAAPVEIRPEVGHHREPPGRNGHGGFEDELRHLKPRPWDIVEIVAKPDDVWVPAPVLQFCVPPNPLLATLRLRAQLNLYKIRNCRNIAGLERQLEPYTAPTNPASGLPSVSGFGQLVAPGLSGLRPTPYHYSVLIERAKQLCQVAAQFESGMLAAIEKRDAEAYTLLRARNDAELMRSQVRLQDLRIAEAESNVRLAERQQERTQLELDHWQELLEEGTTDLEEGAVAALYAAVAMYSGAAILNFAAATVPSFTPGSNISSAGAALSSLGQVASTTSQILSIQASYERRRQDWQYQRRLSQADVRIAQQSVTLAENRLSIAREERAIAGLQADHADTVVNFLTNKFTTAELYAWMGDTLEQVYRWFLQQATATTHLAAAELGFVLQEVPPPFIRSDYWEPPSAPSGPSGEPPDRRGLTGSARLLQDIYRLDQHAFEKNTRKLHLTKTISLGQVAPVELQRFRQTGVLPFATTLEMFDREFPGHYLRLIKRVRISVVALVPPTHGIRATLASTGVSRVVISGSGGPFETVVVRRDPQLVALSSAMNASGVFELDPQPELLMPFEGLGLETHWEFRMPRAANLWCDYRAVADVLWTGEFTALPSFDLAEKVRRELGDEMILDRPFSFRHELSDAWWDLHNPDQTATPMTVRFETKRADFAPNLANLRIHHVTLFFALAEGQALEIEVKHLKLTTAGSTTDGGGDKTKDGTISTRRGKLVPLQNREPIGQWELVLPNTPTARSWLADGRTTDILLVITYRGESPTWPA